MGKRFALEPLPLTVFMKIETVIDNIRHEIDALRGDEAKQKTYSSERTFPSETAAEEAFTRSKEKLFAIKGWSGLSIFTANFSLHDSTGNQLVEQQPRVGDYIRIELPGPLPENWVQVIHVANDDRSAEFTVKPSPNPQRNEEAAPEVAHFFQSQARSTFRVELAGDTINASEIGQHEAINNQDEQSGDRALLNTLIAEAGWLFHQTIQWKALTDYLVHID